MNGMISSKRSKVFLCFLHTEVSATCILFGPIFCYDKFTRVRSNRLCIPLILSMDAHEPNQMTFQIGMSGIARPPPIKRCKRSISVKGQVLDPMKPGVLRVRNLGPWPLSDRCHLQSTSATGKKEWDERDWGCGMRLVELNMLNSPGCQGARKTRMDQWRHHVRDSTSGALEIPIMSWQSSHLLWLEISCVN